MIGDITLKTKYDCVCRSMSLRLDAHLSWKQQEQAIYAQYSSSSVEVQSLGT